MFVLKSPMNTTILPSGTDFDAAASKAETLASLLGSPVDLLEDGIVITFEPTKKVWMRHDY